MASRLKNEFGTPALSRKRRKILLQKLKDLLRSEVQEFLQACGMNNPIFDPFRVELIGTARIKWEYSPRPLIGADGSLSVSPDGFLIRIDQQLKTRQFRLRSTAAHELMHTFFYDVGKRPPTRLGRDPNARWHFLLEEEMCNCLAREFLVPTFSVRRILARRSELKNPSVEELEFLKSMYVVSSDILAYRLISDLRIWNATFTKFLKEGSTFVAKTRMKNRNSNDFEAFRIPAVIGETSESEWIEVIRKSLISAIAESRSREEVDLSGKHVIVESKRDSSSPLSVYALTWIGQSSSLGAEKVSEAASVQATLPFS